MNINDIEKYQPLYWLHFDPENPQEAYIEPVTVCYKKNNAFWVLTEDNKQQAFRSGNLGIELFLSEKDALARKKQNEEYYLKKKKAKEREEAKKERIIKQKKRINSIHLLLPSDFSKSKNQERNIVILFTRVEKYNEEKYLLIVGIDVFTAKIVRLVDNHAGDRAKFGYCSYDKKYEEELTYKTVIKVPCEFYNSEESTNLLRIKGKYKILGVTDLSELIKKYRCLFKNHNLPFNFTEANGIINILKLNSDKDMIFRTNFDCNIKEHKGTYQLKMGDYFINIDKENNDKYRVDGKHFRGYALIIAEYDVANKKFKKQRALKLQPLKEDQNTMQKWQYDYEEQYNEMEYSYPISQIARREFEMLQAGEYEENIDDYELWDYENEDEPDMHLDYFPDGSDIEGCDDFDNYYDEFEKIEKSHSEYLYGDVYSDEFAVNFDFVDNED